MHCIDNNEPCTVQFIEINIFCNFFYGNTITFAAEINLQQINYILIIIYYQNVT